MTAPSRERRRRPGSQSPRRSLAPRSVRGRLVATYSVIAIALAAGGMTAFTVLLHRGLYATLDAALYARSAPLVASVRAAAP
ncbi:MAG: hypothetical protein ACYC1D_19400, partial [Acidimicrobiales bacterium]